MPKFGRADANCSFCGKSQEQVKIIVGPAGVFICNECVDLCVELLKAISDESSDEDARRASGPLFSREIRRLSQLIDFMYTRPRESLMDEERYELAYDEAKRILGSQTESD